MNKKDIKDVMMYENELRSFFSVIFHIFLSLLSLFYFSLLFYSISSSFCFWHICLSVVILLFFYIVCLWFFLSLWLFLLISYNLFYFPISLLSLTAFFTSLLFSTFYFPFPFFSPVLFFLTLDFVSSVMFSRLLI